MRRLESLAVSLLFLGGNLALLLGIVSFVFGIKIEVLTLRQWAILIGAVTSVLLIDTIFNDARLVHEMYVVAVVESCAALFVGVSLVALSVISDLTLAIILLSFLSFCALIYRWAYLGYSQK